jgi:5'-nucleotidase / UDP-sugar diphosphatase
MKKGFKTILSIFITLFLLVPVGLTAKTFQLTVLHSNDHHGHFMKFNPYPVKDVGGLAAQSTLVNVVRAEVQKAGGSVLVLSGGDINTGIPESDMQDCEPDIKAMNMIGYDAMALGNHEFDNSRDVLNKQLGWAKFPFLSANIFLKGTNKTLVDPYVIKEINGLKVAILGLTTQSTPILTLPDNVNDLDFRNPVDIARKMVPMLKKKADIVIALTHLGFYKDNDSKGDIALAKAVPSLDVIIGGHSHSKITEAVVVGKTVIVQAGGYSEYMGRLDLTINTSSKSVDHKYELLPVNTKKRVKFNGKKYYTYVSKGYVEDGDILKAMEPFKNKADELLSQPVGKTSVALVGGKSESRGMETNLGNLITDAMKAKTGADIGMQNGGGIRAGIAPGTITYRDILTVQPFGNTLVIIKMTGAQIIEVLDYSAGKVGNGAFMQVSGLSFTIKNGKAIKVMVGNSPINKSKIFKVVTNNFVGAGGDGYKMLKPLAKEDTGFVDAEAIKDYLAMKSSIAPKLEGRIKMMK